MSQINHGFTDKAWEIGKSEARQKLYAVARRRGTIPYSDLSGRITAVHMEPHDIRLGYFLGEISREDNENGMGLTSVLVVHKTGDQLPGFGFFELAENLGRDVADEEACWIRELNTVHEHWARESK
jgi:hypothetical protein